MKKSFIILALTLTPIISNAASPAKMVKAQLWYEGISSQPKSAPILEKNDKTKPTKTVSSTNFVEELSRPMHMVLKKHQIILNQ